MRTSKFSPWLWVALILDIPITALLFWQSAKQASRLLPYRSVTDWTSDPILLLATAFACLGFIGVVMALLGDRRALLCWNVCHLALGFAFNLSFSMTISDVLRRFSGSPMLQIVMSASVIATIAAYMANRQIRDGAKDLHTANSN
jgi:hypothetical protein